MPNIIRIKDLEKETNLTGAIFPIDNTGYTYNVRQASILDLKEYILSGFTGGTGAGSSGTSGINGVDGIDGTTPCITITSNSIRIVTLFTTTTTTTAAVTTTTTAAVTTTTTAAVTTTTTTAATTTTTTTAAVTTTTTTAVTTTTTTTVALSFSGNFLPETCQIEILSFVGGSGIYQANTITYSNSTDAINGTFSDCTSRTYDSVTNGDRYVVVRDKNNTSNNYYLYWIVTGC